MALNRTTQVQSKQTTQLNTRDPFVQWQVVDIQFPETVGGDLVIPHNLQVQNPRDVHWRVIKQYTNGTIYEPVAVDAKKWTTSYIVLRSDTPQWTGRLLLGTVERVEEFPVHEFDIPDEAHCCGEGDGGVDGEECFIPCATQGMKVAPSGADGVSCVVPAAAWTNSPWTEIEAATPNDWILCAVVPLPGTYEHDNFYDIDIGVGTAGNEFVVATVSGYCGSAVVTAADNGNYLTLPIPADVIPANSRVSARVRQNSSAGGTYRVAIQYYQKPLDDETILPTVITGPEVWPEGAAATIPANTSVAWANGAWTEFVSATGSDWVLGNLTMHCDPGSGATFEIDVGIGEPGSEEVITTIRGNNTDFGIGHGMQGGPMNHVLRPGLVAIPAGSRVSMRQRKSNTNNVSARVKAVFYRQANRAWTTAKPLKSAPSAADPIVLSSPGAGVFGSWVEFIPNTSTEIAVTAIVHSYSHGLGTLTYQIGIGASGSESPKLTVGGVGAGTFTQGGQTYLPLNIGVKLPANQRVAMRLASAVGGSTGAAFQYIESPDFTMADNVEMSTVASGGAGPMSSTPWTYSGWAELTPAVPTDTRITAVVYGGLTDEVEIDLGVGSSGFEQVITTLRLSRTGGTATTNPWALLPVPLCISAGTRLSIRERHSTTATTSATFGFIGTSISGEDAVCGPDIEGGSSSGGPGTGDISGPGSSIDNEIVRWNGVSGGSIQGSGITIPDGETGVLRGSNTGDQNIFKTISVSGQSDIVADGTSDVLNVAAGTGMTVLTNSTTDTLTITLAKNLFDRVVVPGQTDIVADLVGDTLTLKPGARITITTNPSTDEVTFDVVEHSWIPLVDGSEPPVFITNGAGVLILTAYP